MWFVLIEHLWIKILVFYNVKVGKILYWASLVWFNLCAEKHMSSIIVTHANSWYLVWNMFLRSLKLGGWASGQGHLLQAPLISLQRSDRNRSTGRYYPCWLDTYLCYRKGEMSMLHECMFQAQYYLTKCSTSQAMLSFWANLVHPNPIMSLMRAGFPGQLAFAILITIHHTIITMSHWYSIPETDWDWAWWDQVLQAHWASHPNDLKVKVKV